MIVVTGATGNVGRALVRMLAGSGEAVTAMARRISRTDVPDGVRAVAADLGEPESLVPALKGAKALFLLVAGEDPVGILERAAAAGPRSSRRSRKGSTPPTLAVRRRRRTSPMPSPPPWSSHGAGH